MISSSIKVKRPITIKTIVTEQFKRQTEDELNKELHMLENQILQLELQNKQIQDQAASYASMYSGNEAKQIQEALTEIAAKIQQMNIFKQELHSQRESINHMTLDNMIITGSLENYVELSVGENIYDKFKEAEIIIKDGIIQEIRG